MALETTASEQVPALGRLGVWVGAGSCALWLWLYMADFHVNPTMPVYALAAPVLVILTLPFRRRPGRMVGGLAAILLMNFLYQKLVSPADSVRPAFALVMLVYFFSMAPLRTENGLRTLAIGFGLFFAASFTLFLLTLYFDQARVFRSIIYAHVEDELIAEFGREQAMSMGFEQGGLTGLLFIFGYQVASGLVFLLGLMLLSRGLARWAWTAAFLASVGTLLLMGERSSLAACGTGILVLLWATRRWGYTVLVTAAILVAAWFLMLHIDKVEDLRGGNVFSRMLGESDIADRLGLQVWALRKVIEYPQGLGLAKVDYWDLLARERPQFMASPHNGYVTRLLLYGWPVGIFTVMVLVRLVRMARASVRAHGVGMLSGLEVMALSALAAVMGNGLLHNDSFVTFNPDTLAMLFFYAACFETREAAMIAEESVLYGGLETAAPEADPALQ